jgi:16S rRNA (adenine1518-N6/adenine1519-N6)-dimethyltransferase
MPNKALGQHWLKDRSVLESIAASADLTKDDIVLEIGPGLGTLTSVLLSRAKEVIAVEYDEHLARTLPEQFPHNNLIVHRSDILSFDLSAVPSGYKVVANVPYYITSKIVKMLMTANNRPVCTVLLVQKEVAERLAAQAGDMSILAISAQVFAEVSLGDIVPAQLFIPPPKVDSQVVILKTRQKPLISEHEQKAFFRIVKAGFSAKRKKLRSSLSGGLGLTKSEIESILQNTAIDSNLRAEDLSIRDWQAIMRVYAPQ